MKNDFEENDVHIYPSNLNEIEDFQNKYSVEIPQDLRDYYLEIDGIENESLNNLYEFYNMNLTKKIND